MNAEQARYKSKLKAEELRLIRARERIEKVEAWIATGIRLGQTSHTITGPKAYDDVDEETREYFENLGYTIISTDTESGVSVTISWV